MDYLASNKIAIVDLGASKVVHEKLNDDLVRRKIGGAGITCELYERFKEEEPIILGTGLFTGTLVPASALGMITAKHPATGKICHAPLTLYAGMELKYSGFDYIVIKGNAPKPVYLWVHDGIADIQDAKDLWGKDVWTATDSIRDAMGDALIQILGIGKAGEAGSDISQVCVNYWASGDRWGFGKLFGKKKLKAVALRGMSLLEIADPEGFVRGCKNLLQAVKGGPFAGKRGIAELSAAMGEDIRKWLEPITHRHLSCFNTPFPSNTFVFLNEDPKRLKESDQDEPGFLITDVYGLLGFNKMGLSAAESAGILKECTRAGVDGVAVAELNQKAGITKVEAIQRSLDDFKGPSGNAFQGPFSPWAPQRPIFADFDLPADGSQTADWWKRRQALAYLFGLHPLFVLMSPELTAEKLLELAAIGTGLEFTPETLEQAVRDILF